MKNKKMKILKKIMLGCLIVISVELLAMLGIKIFRERNVLHNDELSDLIKIDNGYVGVGSSDFSDSKYVEKNIYNYNDKKIVANRAKIAIYDNNLNLVKENSYKSDYDSNFYSILKVEDGYVVVGSFVSEKKQLESGVRDALIVKYDNDLNVVWSSTYSVLDDTEFYKIIKDDDNYVVVGQSIYENMVMGSHITGGGIIVRYSQNGELLANNNYGGNKSGIFNDVVKVDDGYIVCGRDAANYGILVKFTKDFNRDEKDYNLISKKVLWQRIYSNTDTEGFTSMVLINDTLYLSGALNISDEKNDDGSIKYKYDAGIVLYNTSGKYLGKKITLNDDIHNLFTSITTDNKYLYLTTLLDVDNKDSKKNSMLIKYDLDGNVVDKKVYSDNNKNNILNRIIKMDNDYLVIGTSDTKCSLFNGCDYEPVIKIYDNELNAVN